MVPPIDIEQLAAQARAASENAYAPYSRFRVGAAVLAGGEIFTGCNVENASFGLTLCAERSAVGAAIAAGQKFIDAIAIYTDTDSATPPCGACRQVLAEFGPAMEVYLISRDGPPTRYSLSDLLPHTFTLPPKSK